MHGREAEQQETRRVHGAPDTFRDDGSSQKRGDLDGEEEPERNNAPCDCAWLPFRCHGYEYVDEVEVHEVVAYQRCHVDEREDNGEPSDEAMEVEKPRATGSAAQHARGKEQAPEHGGC